MPRFFQYLLIFAIASLFYYEKQYPDTKIKHRFLVLFPAYAEDAVIVNSVQTFLQQDYPEEFYQIVTISDHQKEETVRQLRNLPIITLIATYENSTKAKALKFAIDKIEGNFDTVVILDADNLAPPNFLSEINKMRAIRAKTIQVHRKGMINQSQISLLDGLSEEINTCFFRKGHQALGLSPALSGSGMAFEYKWFKENIRKVWTSGEDKEIEALLLKQKEKILYTHHLCIYDKKTEKQNTISQQRKRWIAAQYQALITNLPHLPHAIISLNFSYIDKIIQWMLPPRLIQLTLVFGITLLLIIFNVSNSYKWIILSIAQIVSMAIPIPKEDWNAALFQSLIHIPKLTLMTIINILHLKDTPKKFFHTKHE